MEKKRGEERSLGIEYDATVGNTRNGLNLTRGHSPFPSHPPSHLHTYTLLLLLLLLLVVQLRLYLRLYYKYNLDKKKIRIKKGICHSQSPRPPCLSIYPLRSDFLNTFRVWMGCDTHTKNAHRIFISSRRVSFYFMRLDVRRRRCKHRQRERESKKKTRGNFACLPAWVLFNTRHSSAS